MKDLEEQRDCVKFSFKLGKTFTDPLWCCKRLMERIVWAVRNVTSGNSVSNRSERPSKTTPRMVVPLYKQTGRLSVWILVTSLKGKTSQKNLNYDARLIPGTRWKFLDVLRWAFILSWYHQVVYNIYRFSILLCGLRTAPSDATSPSLLFTLKLVFCSISPSRAFNYRTKSDEEMSVRCGASLVTILDAMYIIQYPSSAVFVAVCSWDVLFVAAVHWFPTYGYQTILFGSMFYFIIIATDTHEVLKN